jgi:cytochrome c553
MSYKRNQIEEAIARIFDPNSKEPPSELRTRIKRLLELDRSIGRKRRSKDAEEANFAFFSDEAPGTGADILFSEYEAFALLNALRIMEHGWPQGFAVSIMRRMRLDLEKEHARILRQDPVKLFDLQAIRANASPDDIAVDNTDPVFLTLASKTQRSPDDEQTFCAVCHGSDKVGEFSRDVVASTLTMFEIATIVHRLHEQLKQTEPRRRGRA